MDSIRSQRHSIRLQGYDYAQAGTYFVTLVTADRACRFGEIVDGEMRLNPVGQIVLLEWQQLPGRFAGLELDAFVMMPNHLHGILFLCPPESTTPALVTGAAERSVPQRTISGDHPPTPALRPLDNPGSVNGREINAANPLLRVDPSSLGAIVRAFKSSTTLRYRRTRWASPGALWQRNYYEHIIRTLAALERIRAYILTNPVQWELDSENPDRENK